MTYYVKDVAKLTGLKYQDSIDEIKKIDSNFKLTGGYQTKLDFNTFKAVCQKHNIEVDDDGHITKYTNTDDDTTKFTPITPVVKPAIKISGDQRNLNEYNEMKCEAIDPLKVRAEMRQVPSNSIVVLEVIKHLKPEKSIINNTLIRDERYLQSLFNKYNYLLVPTNFAHRLRDSLRPMFIKIYVTDTFTNKLIAFNTETALHAFIINV